MSKQTPKDQTAPQHEPERQVSMKGATDVVGKHGGPAITPPSHHHKPPKSRTKGKNPPKASSPGKGATTPKQPAPRTPAGKKRSHAPTGRADGPLARRRRLRVRLVVALLLLVNVAVGVVVSMTDLTWATSLAVLIGSVIVAPLLLALLLRRKR